MIDQLELLRSIQARLLHDAERPDLVEDIELVWTRKLGAVRGNGVLIVTTARELTPNGGNGWTGFDGIDFRILDTAIMDAVDEVGATGMIDRFIVRAQHNEGALSGAEVDQLLA